MAFQYDYNQQQQGGTTSPGGNAQTPIQSGPPQSGSPVPYSSNSQGGSNGAPSNDAKTTLW